LLQVKDDLLLKIKSKALLFLVQDCFFLHLVSKCYFPLAIIVVVNLAKVC